MSLRGNVHVFKRKYACTCGPNHEHVGSCLNNSKLVGKETKRL